jgi:hypothetical protein
MKNKMGGLEVFYKCSIMSKTSLKSHHSTNDFPNVGNKLQYSILTIVLCTTAYHAKIFIFSEQSTSKDQEQTNFNQKMNGVSSRPNGLPNTKYQVNFYIVLETTISSDLFTEVMKSCNL